MNDKMVAINQIPRNFDEFKSKFVIGYHGTESQFDRFDSDFLGGNTGAPSSKLGFFFASNKEVAKSYASKLNKTIETNLKRISEIKKEIEALTGDNYWIVGNKLFRNEYGEELGKKLDVLLDELQTLESDNESADFYEGFDDEVELSDTGRVLERYLDLGNSFVYDMQGESYRKESYFSIINKAKSGGYNSVTIKNTYDGATGLGATFETDIYVVFDASQIYELSELRQLWNKEAKRLKDLGISNIQESKIMLLSETLSENCIANLKSIFKE